MIVRVLLVFKAIFYLILAYGIWLLIPKLHTGSTESMIIWVAPAGISLIVFVLRVFFCLYASCTGRNCLGMTDTFLKNNTKHIKRSLK